MKRNTEAIFKDYKLWFAAAAAMHLLFAILLGRVGLMAFAFYNLFATMLYSVCSGLGEQYLHRLLRVTYIETCAFVLLGAAILEIRWQYSIALYLLFFLCFSTSLTAALMLGTKAKRYEQEWKDATVDELTGDVQ